MLLDILDQAGCMFDLRCILGQDSEVMHGRRKGGDNFESENSGEDTRCELFTAVYLTIEPSGCS